MGKGMAIVGLILGYVTVLIPIAIFVIGILSAIAIGPMGDIFSTASKDASRSSLESAYYSLQAGSTHAGC